MDALNLLKRKTKPAAQPLYVVHGDEDFLKRQVIDYLQHLVLGDEINDFTLSVYSGDKLDFATVMDELSTHSFFGGSRVVIVEQADSFVTEHRARLENVVSELPSSGVLVLVVKSWPANTRLAKMIDADAIINCKALTSKTLPGWCVEWAASKYDKQLSRTAAGLLVDLVGQDMGQLNQELDKLAVYVGKNGRITESDVDKLVGRSQAESTWIIFDAIGEGNPGKALSILGQLFDRGEEPMKVLGAFTIQLRRLGQAGRLAQQGMPMRAALLESGVPEFFVRGYLKQLQHLGRERAAKLYDWLINLHMDMRGNSELPPRALMERMVVRLARRS